MSPNTVRKIIQIDEEKCNGCGNCIDSCVEGALVLINGKAKLVKDQYCDGLAACLKECPTDALHIIEREAEEFDEEAVKTHLEMKKPEAGELCGCQGAAVKELVTKHDRLDKSSSSPLASELSHWPVQLTLVPPGAKFLNQADVMLIAHCVPFAYAGLHTDFLRGHAVLTACPKLDNAEAHLAKLTEIIKNSNMKSLTVVRMEVPCCSGLTFIAKNALKKSGTNLPFKEIVVGINGEIK